ncbi:UNVERIFIED_CONTAM: ehhadh [Trichonephila clavipes]|jgi:3-hydroxyacyl-CoA dehydrogenase|uniref:Enoyl-CoA hydratase/isomerase family protein n=2 Tax=Paracoccaceae TaxID=31989 RepID=A0ABS6J7Z0_9RHOB|nr:MULTISPECIES: 3-hydroxyacyl-CoA dehydrogenase NAD-binding domain-containing protein [Paracoccaceae]OHC55538.1 MAG: enoyl-CoA hydratase [Rhodobacterales bacterium RIFCSPHIGHO2_02_FULL_62_130]OHC58084.1 MAG: enoyl-CoA hydratase [Rhodobacterales bacterium RIFCSPHIGHO2_12_FULL_62_75]MBU9699693.1 enoyl-CoA hydratase/isomerase family protein [Rhodobacter amnigenus]MBV4390920.1 enoyl-CoA hydratase/isomerase family protein [Rhodobacter amnigenus]MDR5653850.1 3-hydroxyacyl-CoA dehydrogenase NAD-bind
MSVDLNLSGGAAILTFDNAPLNLLSAEVRAGLMRGMDAAMAQGATRLIVTGAGNTFVAGADAREFGLPPIEPHLNDVLLHLAGLAIPTIAAINGAALGGGLEIALACRYRIAAPGAQLGLPEVVLGIVPGAGGTQRLPRLIGVKAALDMIVTGKAIAAGKALSLGLVDKLADNPLAVALAIDDALLAAARGPDEQPAPQVDEDAVAAMLAHAKRRLTGQIAPPIAVGLVAASATLPLAEGLARERAAFLDLRASAQARALRHVFFTERAAGNRGRDYPRPARDIATAIVVGGGNMGASIAYAFATGGIAVTIVERDATAAGRAEDNLRKLVDQGVARGTLSAIDGEAVHGRLTTVAGYDNLPPADLAIEAAFEDFDVKRAIFAELEAALPPETILATNTSYLDVNRLADDLKNPTRFLGLHFFSPAHVMKLLEIVKGERTSPETLGAGFALARRLGKVPVLSGVCDGFIGNRILTRYRQEANLLLVEGALPAEIDAAMQGFGMAMGPYEAQDMSGLDIAYANIRRQNAGATPRHVPLVERLVEDHKRLGRKTGAGWYDYGAEGKPVVSALVTEEIHRVSAEAGKTRRSFTAEGIVERITLAMIAEACAILDEGIAERPQDIDLALVHGYGFPRWRGGLMHHADSLGAKDLLARYAALATADPQGWAVPPLLARLAAKGLTLDSLNAAKANA